MKKCVIYSRVSTVQQNFETQKEDLLRYAKANDFDVKAIYGESISGYDPNADRVEYDKMKEYVIKNDINQILIWELSRLGRSTSQTLNEINFFSKKNINIYFKKENLNTLSDDASNKLLISLLSSIAELERDTTLGRMARGRYSSVMKGKRAGYCFLPYGFSADKDGYLQINEKESKIINEIFDNYVNGVPIRRIAINLNSKGIPTRHTTFGKRREMANGDSFKILWKNNSINIILRNTIYKGERNYKGEIVKVPQIIDNERWNKAQDILKNRIGYRARTKYHYLFKTKILCGNCGYLYQTRTETRYPGQPSFYFCNSKSMNVKCDGGQFDSKFLDDILYKSLFNQSLSVETQSYFKDEQKKLINIEEKNKQLEYFLGEVGIINAKKKRVNNMYKNGYISEVEFNKEQTTLRNELISNENSIKQIQDFIKKYKDVNVIDILKAGKEETNYDTQYEYTQKYVDKILIYNVDNYDIEDLKKYTKKWEGYVRNTNAFNKDKVVYIELFAFNNPLPIKVLLTSWTKRYYTEFYFGWFDVMKYSKEKSTLSFDNNVIQKITR